MRRISLIVVALAFAAPATAFGVSDKTLSPQSAATANKQVANLTAQVRALQKQVKTLQAQTKALQKELKSAENETAWNYAGDACQTALVTDALQSTWLVIDQISAATQPGKTYFNAQTPVNDKQACRALKLVRAQPTPGVPPNTALFDPFITWLFGS